jgi:hypothetical protein
MRISVLSNDLPEPNYYRRSSDAAVQRPPYIFCKQDGSVSLSHSPPKKPCLSPFPLSHNLFFSLLFRAGANPWRIVDQIRNKLKIPAAALQIPIGAEDAFEGVIDLVRWKVIRHEGKQGYVPVWFSTTPEGKHFLTFFFAIAKKSSRAMIYLQSSSSRPRASGLSLSRLWRMWTTTLPSSSWKRSL